MENSSKKMYIPRPERRIFEKNSVNATMPSGNTVTYELDRVEYVENYGILIYRKGLKQPLKGFVYPEAIYAINRCKKVFIESLNLLKNKFVLTLVFFSFVFARKKFVNWVIDVWIKFCTTEIDAHIIQSKYMTGVARELRIFLEVFLEKLEVEEFQRNKLAAIFSHCIEYDDAYRYRVQDVITLITDDEEMKVNPFNEIKRIMRIYAKRESGDLVWKMKRFERAFFFLTFFPSIKKKFVESLEHISIAKMKFDNVDVYNVLERGDYKFLGLTYKERYQQWLAIHGGAPPKQLIIK